jgi:isoleucyl-tRNA synthetase
MTKEKQLKESVFLPKTEFQMRGDLAQKELLWIEKWEKKDLFHQLRLLSKGKPKFILHFGPPYANGHIHMGHALIGVLKDAVNKSYQMLGYDAPLVIGWDCHGLPIGWKIEEMYLKQGRKREDVPVLEFLKQCREFAQHWLDVQKEEFKRLGIITDYKNPYSTMAKESEAIICEKFFEILKKGLVYRGKKPVMWAVVEKTALAEAEVEYQDKESDAIFVKFPIVTTGSKKLEKASAVIWTTTPWTIPGNRAIAYSETINYVVIEANSERYVIAEDLLQKFSDEAGVGHCEVIDRVCKEDLEGTVCSHPLANLGFSREVPLLPAHHVTTDAGTGLVHIAPSHGLDDFILGQKFGLAIEDSVNDDGTMNAKLPHFGGIHVYKVNQPVIDELKSAGNLLRAYKITHSYPYSWRSKSPLIFRTTDQWFISIDRIRGTLLEEIDKTKWYPSQYVNRIRSMVEKRPDWCISRQRLWGVPIALFLEKATGNILMDEEVLARTIEVFKGEGMEAWYTRETSHFLGPKYNPDDYVRVTDTLEVWFESACSHHYVLETRDDMQWPADLYFEGSDQHRGWFQSSLVESVCVTGKAPYRNVATNGFVLDKNGKKMSKSLGNVISPDEITSTLGADILRLWCLNSDYSEDVRIGNEILKQQQDLYRRFRNTLRYLLGVTSNFNTADAVVYEDMPELEKFVLKRLYDLDLMMRESIERYDFQTFCVALQTFCANDLSAFYFDIRKDSVYCDAMDNPKRRACMTVMSEIFMCLSHWLAPILSFTAEEAWEMSPLNKRKTSIHTELFPKIPVQWNNKLVIQKWAFIQSVRKLLTETLETERAAKRIGSSLEAAVTVYALSPDDLLIMESVDMAEIAIVSSAEIVHVSEMPPGIALDSAISVGVAVRQATGLKCERCWKIGEDVTKQRTEHYGDANLCHRCLSVISSLPD